MDGSGVLKLIDNSGNQVGRVVNNVMEVTKHGIKVVDGSVLFRTADDVNLSNPNWVNNPPYSLNVPVTEFVTSQAESVFIRVYNSSSPNGQWMMHVNDFNKLNLDSHNIRDILALPGLPTKYAKVTVPAGTNLRAGGVRHQDWGDGFLNGGGTQFQILDDYNSQGFIFEELGNLN